MPGVLNPYKLIFSIARRINRPLILDGAMGSQLQKKFKTDDSLWMSYLNKTNPSAVLDLHQKYIKAGADIITTNTFRSNPWAVRDHKNVRFSDLAFMATTIAKHAVAGTPVIIAGSNPPAEDCYQKFRTLTYERLKDNHIRHIKTLIGGSHFILNETQSHMDEIEIICEYSSKKSIPFIISLYFNDNLRILSGEKLDKVVKYVKKFNPIAIAFNCIKPGVFLKFYKSHVFDYNWGIYSNCGKGDIEDNIECLTPGEYKNFIKKILPKSPSFIGACCGSSPEHIKQIKLLLDGRIKG